MKKLLTILLFLQVAKFYATHIVGGEMFYDYLGNDKYRMTLRIYRDCFNGQAAFDGMPQTGGQVTPARITVREVAGNLVGVYDIGKPVVTNIPATINSPCVEPPDGVCVEEGVYTYTLTLPPKKGGYYIIYQRCCRNNTILNLLMPGEQGSTYFTKIPGPEDASANSSPRFTNFPAIFLCHNYSFTFNHAAIDPDGDQLIYSLCPPFKGIDGCCTYVGNPNQPSASPACQNPPSSCPQEAPAPAYPLVSFIAPYSGAYPMASNPALSINAVTGKLTGKPNLQGQFVVGICVDEYRNGKLLNRHYRDFQFNIVTCQGVLSDFNNDLKCQGNTFSFSNQSLGGNVFHWDFGVPGIKSDTSSLTNPIYTFPDTGKYEITLVASAGGACKDTIKKTILVFPALNVNFTKPAVQCLKTNSYEFKVAGSYSNNTIFTWDFSNVANPPSSSSLNPKNITFTQAGKYFVKLSAKHYACVDSFIDTVRVINEPITNIGDITPVCIGTLVKFLDASIVEGQTINTWSFGDGYVSNDKEPIHTYKDPGVFKVRLIVEAAGLCSDTNYRVFTVSPKPTAGFIAEPKKTTLLDPEVIFKNRSSGDAATYKYRFGDGESAAFAEGKHTYVGDGTFTITQIVTNGLGCVDSTSETIIILPEFRLWIPNAFTPDGNNLNEVYKPSVIGASYYTFEVFDRWGQKLFSTNNPEQGWNGYFKGKDCKQDVYVWKISFRNAVSQETETHLGHFTLLKNP